MGRVNLPYIRTWKAKYKGKTYTYVRFRYQGHDIPMPSVDSPDFGELYSYYRRTLVGSAGAAPSPGVTTFDWLLQKYQASPEYKRLAERTRADYTSLLAPIAKQFGNKSYKALRKKDVVFLIRDPLAGTPRRADQAVAALSAVYTWAVGRDLVATNPCKKVGKLYRSGDGYRAWTADEIERFVSVCSDWEWLVFCLGYYTSMRPGDLVKLTWFQYNGHKIKTVQSKTRKSIVVDVHPELKAALDAQGRKEGPIIQRPDGSPYRNSSQLSNRWSSAMRRHGLLGCTIHGLRTTSSSILAEEGATEAQIMSVTGHKTAAMVKRYTRDANQARLNKGAVAMLPTVRRK